MAKYKIDNSLQDETKEYMKDVLKKLKSDGEKIDDSWNASLYLIAGYYDTIITCDKELSESGLTVLDRFNSTVAHPLIKVKNDASIQLQKLLIEFLLTKKSALRINDVTSEDDSPLMQFVNKKSKVESR